MTQTNKPTMKNLIHTIASCCFLIWLVGFFAYDQNGLFHIFIICAVIAAVTRYLMHKKRKVVKE
jgi:hypothetical protein